MVVTAPADLLSITDIPTRAVRRTEGISGGDTLQMSAAEQPD
jgi:hypothetical protein